MRRKLLILKKKRRFISKASGSNGSAYIFLSAGVSAELFQETLQFAKTSGSKFNGVLCGRATWANGVEPFVTQGEGAAKEWLQTQGRTNIEALNNVLQKTATPIRL